jgi:uncharacterized Tic20 family protein
VTTPTPDQPTPDRPDEGEREPPAYSHSPGPAPGQDVPGQDAPGQSMPDQAPPPYAYPQRAYGPAPMSQSEAQLWVLGAHLGPLVLSFIAPLIVMLVAERRSPFVRSQAVEALNFQISFLIYFLIASLSLLILIGFVLLPVLGVLWLVFMIVAAVKSSGGQDYRYPLTIRFVR